MATTGAASIPQMRRENFSLEKQTVFHFSPLSHKEITHNCFHYWRRREPPVCLRCGENSSRIFSKVKIYLLFYKKRKFFTGKQTVLLAQAATALCNSHCCSFRRNPLNLLWPLSRNTHRRSASCLRAARASKSKWRAVCYITGKRI